MNLMCGVTDVIVVSNIHSQYALHLLPVNLFLCNWVLKKLFQVTYIGVMDKFKEAIDVLQSIDFLPCRYSQRLPPSPLP